MAVELTNELGTITISEDLILDIAGHAAVENYGIVGMNAKRAGDSFIELFRIDNLRRGVELTAVSPDTVDIDLYVTLEYGVSLPAVAENVKSNVRYRVESLVGVNVRLVNVHVEGVRVTAQ